MTPSPGQEMPLSSRLGFSGHANYQEVATHRDDHLTVGRVTSRRKNLVSD